MHKPKAQNKLNNKVGPKCFILSLESEKKCIEEVSMFNGCGGTT
jgi:hypothetical protein